MCHTKTKLITSSFDSTVSSNSNKQVLCQLAAATCGTPAKLKIITNKAFRW